MKRIGMLTPSSNTVLEPLTARMLEGLPGVSAHFSRISVTEISLTERSDRQFDFEAMLDAACLLAEAEVDVPVWNGTSGSWLGLDRDRALCETLTRETGIAATTSSLAILEAVRRFGIARLGLVTPYTADVNRQIQLRYAEELGISCPVQRYSGLTVNREFASVTAMEVARMVEETAQTRDVDGVAVVCTNMWGAEIAAGAERRFGVPVIDSVSATAWGALRLAGLETGLLQRAWGRIFGLRGFDRRGNDVAYGT